MERKARYWRNVGGIKLQIEDGVSGYLVSTVEEYAEKCFIYCAILCWPEDEREGEGKSKKGIPGYKECAQVPNLLAELAER